ncbi:sensor histidine kinase [Cutibacterium sp. V970]|uniref:sensor histidine kinase n=1 Tax=Cutibacterium sp. V970 TaxID=3446481 RepID=UPI003EE21808
MEASHRGRAVAVRVGMQIGIQVLFAGLVIFTVVMVLVLSPPHVWRILTWAILLVVVHTALMMSHVMDRTRRERWQPILVAAMVAVSILLAIDFPYAAYLTIPLSFVYLDYLAPLHACIAVVVGAVAIVLGGGLTSGWSVGGVVGPVAGAAVAVVVGLSLKAMQAQAVELERLNADLLAVQERLAASQREAGVLEERARLAREIHDTVAQSLSSIGLLLSAVERTAPDHPAIEQVQLAHRTSSEALSETRGLIAELAPPTVADQGLPAVLKRLGATAWSIGGLHVDVDCPDTSDLSMEIQTALLRLCQGAMSNVVRHARAHHATIQISRPDASHVHLRVTDDGVGMDLNAPVREGAFGLHAIRQRVHELSGEVSLTSGPGEGTIVNVDLPVHSATEKSHLVRQGEPS